MRININNGWQGPVAGIATVAALSLQNDPTNATLAFQVGDALDSSGLMAGTQFVADGKVWQVVRRVESPPKVLAYQCKRIDNG